MLNIKDKSILTRCKFHLPGSKEWEFKSSLAYSEYLDREESQDYFYDTYSDYFDKRKGSLGLRDQSHNKIDLENFKIPRIHKDSPVWEMVVSFDEFLTLDTNPDDFKTVINLITKKMSNDKRFKFDLDKMHFEYAVHVNTKNLHAHIKWYYKDEYEKVTYNKTTKKCTTKTVKVKKSDIRTCGKIGKNFFDDLKKDITKALLAKYNSQKKINYENKLKLLAEYKSKIADELTNEQISNDLYSLIKSFKESKPKSYRYMYLEKNQKELVDRINENFFKKNMILNDYKNLFSNNLKEYYDVTANGDKNRINEMIGDELKQLDIDLKNILLKNLKEFNIGGKYQKIIGVAFGKMSNMKAKQFKNYKGYAKKKTNKFNLGLFLSIYNDPTAMRAIRHELSELEKMIKDAQEAKMKY